MFKTVPIIVMASLCLNFSVNAQENKAIDVTTKGIQIGQKIPDALIQNIHNYKTADGKPAITAKLSDFNGKLVILDFWATWCSPCVAMIPKMDSLQQKFKDKVQFISVTYQTEKVVLPFLEKLEKRAGKDYNIPVITDDKDLHKLFPHIYLPHYVWIDPNGIVKAITGYAEITASNIEKMITDTNVKLNRKTDMNIKFTVDKPFLVNGNGGDGSNLIFHSVLTGFTDGVPPGYRIFEPDSLKGRRIVFTNISLLWLYTVIYGGDDKYFSNNKVIFETTHQDKFTTIALGEEFKEWVRSGNSFCYEMQVPAYAMDKFFLYMQHDLEKFFPQYKAVVEKRNAKCLALVRTSTSDKLYSRNKVSKINFTNEGFVMQNWPLEYLVVQLNAMYMQNSPIPVVNMTNYKPWVDISVNANLSDMDELNASLQKYDLKLVEKYAPIDMLIIKDNPAKLKTN